MHGRCPTCGRCRCCGGSTPPAPPVPAAPYIQPPFTIPYPNIAPKWPQGGSTSSPPRVTYINYC